MDAQRSTTVSSGLLERQIVTPEARHFHEVLELRATAYAAVGKTLTNAHDSDDDNARIVLRRYRCRPAGTIRVTLAPTPSNCSYLREPNSMDAFPFWIDAVAGSRMCANPEFRNLGLFDVLHDEMVEAARETGRRYVVGGATGYLIDVYRRRGWSITSHSYRSPAFRDEHVFMYLDTR